MRSKYGEKNLKSDYEQTLDKNFNKALELCSGSYTNEDLIKLLKDGNIPEKQFAALEITELNSEKDAEIFLSNLINCDGKIREAVAQKFSEFVSNEKYREYFSKYPDILAKSTIDINANISRMVIESLALMSDFADFGKTYTQNLISYIEEAFDGLSKIVFRDKKYTINKQLFKLYWCLEGLCNFSQYVDEDTLLDILEKSLEQTEYTVREKVAQIVVKQESKKFVPIREKLKSDSNYYVKNIIK